MNRRKFLIIAGASAAGVAASTLGLDYVNRPLTITRLITTTQTGRPSSSLTGRIGDVRITLEYQDPPTIFQRSTGDARLIVKSLSPVDDTARIQIANLPTGVTFKVWPQDPVPVKAGTAGSAKITFAASNDSLTGLNIPIQIVTQLNETKLPTLPFKLTIIKNPNPPRQWTVTGVNLHETPLDNVIKNYMQANNIRASVLAVTQDKKLIFAHGYTWAEVEYPTTHPTTLFRLASCSKPITGIAINHLIDNGELSLEDKAQDILGLKQPDGSEPPNDPKPADLSSRGFYFHAVTVRNLLQHQIGWGDLPMPGSFDPMWSEEETQKAFHLPTRAQVTKYQIARWAVSQKQFCWPGTRYGYCNFGYILLGMILEKKLGMPYVNVLQELIAKPLGLKRLRQSQSAITGWPPPTDEAYYHYWASESSNSPDLITLEKLKQSLPYTEHIENWDAAGGLSMAATDYAKLLATLTQVTPSNPLLKPDTMSSMFNNFLGWDQFQADPKGGNRWFKGGALDCCATSVCRSLNGYSYALFFNRGFAMDSPKSGGGWPVWPDLDTGTIETSMSSTDLFTDPSINLGSV